jgi:hypothetical protein
MKDPSAEYALADLEASVNEFSRRCWPQITWANHKENRIRGFEFHGDGVVFLSHCMAGRILATMSSGGESEEYVSVCGAEQHGYGGCGLQGIWMEPDKAAELVRDVMRQWDVSKYSPSKQVII